MSLLLSLSLSNKCQSLNYYQSKTESPPFVLGVLFVYAATVSSVGANSTVIGFSKKRPKVVADDKNNNEARIMQVEIAVV